MRFVVVEVVKKGKALAFKMFTFVLKSTLKIEELKVKL